MKRKKIYVIYFLTLIALFSPIGIAVITELNKLARESMSTFGQAALICDTSPFTKKYYTKSCRREKRLEIKAKFIKAAPKRTKTLASESIKQKAIKEMPPEPQMPDNITEVVTSIPKIKIEDPSAKPKVKISKKKRRRAKKKARQKSLV